LSYTRTINSAASLVSEPPLTCRVSSLMLAWYGHALHTELLHCFAVLVACLHACVLVVLACYRYCLACLPWLTCCLLLCFLAAAASYGAATAARMCCPLLLLFWPATASLVSPFLGKQQQQRNHARPPRHEQAAPLLSAKCSRLCLNHELYQLCMPSARLNVPKVSVCRGSS
jgi:hypothetical protein